MFGAPLWEEEISLFLITSNISEPHKTRANSLQAWTLHFKAHHNPPWTFSEVFFFSFFPQTFIFFHKNFFLCIEKK